MEGVIGAKVVIKDSDKAIYPRDVLEGIVMDMTFDKFRTTIGESFDDLVDFKEVQSPYLRSTSYESRIAVMSPERYKELIAVEGEFYRLMGLRRNIGVDRLQKIANKHGMELQMYSDNPGVYNESTGNFYTFEEILGDLIQEEDKDGTGNKR